MTVPPTTGGGAKLLADARDIAREVLRRWAPVVDRESRFPTESIDALKNAGLLGFFVPVDLGGMGGNLRTFCAIASAMGEECLSTAIIWAMHCQQVATLAAACFPDRSPVLSRIASDGLLVASVTTEAGGTGDLTHLRSTLEDVDGGVRVRRVAPVVSYGEHADLFLISMSDPLSNGEAALVLLTKADGGHATTGEWHAMGMRGTQSAPMEFDTVVGRDRVVAGSFRELASRSFVPVGHIGWASAWWGAARGAFNRVLGRARERGKSRGEPVPDSVRHHLARQRVALDLTESTISSLAVTLDEMEARCAPPTAYREPRLLLRVNNVKVASAETSFAVVHELVEACGLSGGYVRASTGLERVFRDLRSASLMFSNDRLLRYNGNLVFIERQEPLGGAWPPAARQASAEVP